MPTVNEPEKIDKLYRMRHSAAHVLAQAVLHLFSDAKLGIGPVIDYGFYYDFDLKRPLTPDDLGWLEKNMYEIMKEKQTFAHDDRTIPEAKEFLKKMNQPYKIELVEELAFQGEKTVSFYKNIDKNGEVKFVDLCRGGHTEHTGQIGAFQLSHVAGAYWRGNEKNPMLQRIYGLCFETEQELKAHVQRLEEAKKRDHKILGPKLGLFTHSVLVGSGLPLFLPKGATVLRLLEQFITDAKLKRGYSFVKIPHLAKKELYIKSGHLGKYDAMMPAIEIEESEHLVVKPMNCPHHFEIFRAEMRSYRDLPLRLSENTTVYRNEKSGELNGLFRVRALMQDDTHHFVRHDQIGSEIQMILDLMKVVYETFGFTDYRCRISTRDPAKAEKYFGSSDLWSLAEKTLKEEAEKWGVPYFIGEGEAAFYGPKIDVMVRDAIGREWQLTTVQLDFTQPENFDLTYIGEDGKEHRPAVLHVAVLGSYERFLGILIEHFSGAFPAWLAPVQVKIIPVAAPFLDYGHTVYDELRNRGLRAELDDGTETLNKKIRKAELEKIPYILVVGEKEKESRTVTVRERGKKEQKVMDVQDFMGNGSGSGTGSTR